MSEVYCTLLYNDAYLPGALVLGQALKGYNVTRDIAVLIGPQVSDFAINRLEQVFQYVISIETISNSSADAEQFHLLARPELERSYSKIHLWNLTQFKKVVFLDADTLPLKSLDSLFEEYPLDSSIPIAASPDIGWPDIFNSGVFVTIPSSATFQNLISRAKAGLSFDGGDQGLLNQYFENRWHRLPFTYNVTPSASYQYTPAYQHFKDNVNVVHFIGSNKPWSHSFTGPQANSSEFEVNWWNIFNRYYDSNLNLKSSDDTPIEVKYAPQEKLDLDNIQPNISHDGVYNAPYQPATISEDIDRWDPTRYQPPIDSKPEAANLIIERYENAWDLPNKDSPAEATVKTREQENQVHSCQQEPPVFQINEDPVKPIFPWENNGSVAERVFPDDYQGFSEYEEEENSYSQDGLDDETQENDITEEVFDFKKTQSALEELSHPGPESQNENVTRVFRDYSQPPENSSFGTGLSNAWDTDPYIQTYVSHATKKFSRKSSPSSWSSPTSPRFESEADLDVKEGIIEAEDELKASHIVHEKISQENEDGVIIKRHGNLELDPLTPNLFGEPKLQPTSRFASEIEPIAEETEEVAEPTVNTSTEEEDEAWDPVKKLEELAELSKLIAFKQAEFEKHFVKMKGKSKLQK